MQINVNNYHVPSGCWTHISPGCIDGGNIKLYKDKSVEECKSKCLEDNTCLSFEYGVAHGGSGGYAPRDCQLQHSATLSNCNGQRWNLDLYVKKSCAQGKSPTNSKTCQRHVLSNCPASTIRRELCRVFDKA